MAPLMGLGPLVVVAGISALYIITTAAFISLYFCSYHVFVKVLPLLGLACLAVLLSEPLTGCIYFIVPSYPEHREEGS